MIASSSPSFSAGSTITLTMSGTGTYTFSLIRVGAATHSVNLDQRRVPLAVASQSGSSVTLRVPSNPVHVPPGPYWLFAMDSAGVPSVGQTILRA